MEIAAAWSEAAAKTTPKIAAVRAVMLFLPGWLLECNILDFRLLFAL